MMPTLYRRRTIILGGVKGILLSTLVARLYYLQVVSSDHYQLLSDKNRLQGRPIIPKRGLITDSLGFSLAENMPIYRAVMMREGIKVGNETLQVATTLLNLSERDVQYIHEQIQTQPKFVPIMLKEDLTWNELVTLELHAADLPGVEIELGHQRCYPQANISCHIIGYVGPANEQEKVKDPELAMLNYIVGKSGVEKKFDLQLRGAPGIKQVEVNARGQVMRQLDQKDSVAGEKLTLSINGELQKKTYEILSQYRRAAAAIMDVHTGQILSFVSYPGFDNNLFISGISRKNWQGILNHPDQPLLNRLTQGLYAPGSLFKMIVALAGLEAGVINKKTLVSCEGYVTLGQHRFHCWHKHGGHGPVHLVQALSQSCDVYFYQLGQKVGIEKIAAMARRFGFGDATGIELPTEKSGVVPSRSWKQKIFGQGWTLGETYNASIGQGYVLATPMQLLVMMAALANGGRLIRPHFVQGAVPEHGNLELDEGHLEIVNAGLKGCVNDQLGTAYNFRIEDPKMSFSGKTATSQVKRISEKQRKQGITQHQLWQEKDHALFGGYAPCDDPRFATIIVIEHGGSGGKVAAPVARDLLKSAIEIVQA